MMKSFLFSIPFFLFSVFLVQTAEAQLEACGLVNFDFSHGCHKKAIQFDVSSCETSLTTPLEATQISCKSSEVTASLKTAQKSYRVVLVKNGKKWEQKGKVWSFAKKPETKGSTSAAVVTEDLTVKLRASTPEENKEASKEAAKENAVHENSSSAVAIGAAGVASGLVAGTGNVISGTAETATVAHEAPTVIPEVKMTPTLPSTPPLPLPAFATHETKNENEWKLKLLGDLMIENENIKNFGDQMSSTANVFNSNDPNNQVSDINALAHFGLQAEKAGHQVVAKFEIGEIFFGESTSGGAQGLKGKNIKTKNLYAKEAIGGAWSAVLGLYTLSSDPRGFILMDNYAGAALVRKSDENKFQLWFAEATNGKPGVVAVTDRYLGFIHTGGVEKEKSWSLFGVYRGTRETFVDSIDLTTEYLGKSEYTWLGLQGANRFGSGFGIEASAIMSMAKFKADSAADGAGSSDSVNSSLAHVLLSYDFGSQWMVSAQQLITSGANDQRSATDKKILTRRKSFASPNPSSAHLLTIATNDGKDDWAGSEKTADRVIGRLDLDEGLQTTILGVKKVFAKDTEILLRYGMLKTSTSKVSTGSSDYGTETDLVISHKIDESATLAAEYGMFKPGKYFVNTDDATLLALSYKLEF